MEVNIAAVTLYLIPTSQYLNIDRIIKSTNGTRGGIHWSHFDKNGTEWITTFTNITAKRKKNTKFGGGGSHFQNEDAVQYARKYWTVASTNENARFHFGM